MPTGRKPRCALRVSVIGNRRFGDTDDKPTPEAEQMKARAAKALDEVWQALFDSISKTVDYALPFGSKHMRDLFSDEPPRLGVLTSLAAGADQLGASTALEAGRRQEALSVELEAILPFPKEDYPGLPEARRPEFRADEAETLHTLSAQATRVVRLNGDYQTDKSREAAYAQARDLLLQNADIVIAVYRPAATGGTAGTLESVGLALQQQIPVVAIQLSESDSRVEVLPREPDRSGRPLPDSDWRSGVLACVREQLVLPEALAATEHAEGDHEAGHLEHVLFRVGLMSGSTRPPWLCRNRFMAMVFAGVWHGLQAVAGFHAGRDLRERLRKLQHGGSDGVTVQPYARFYDLASELAGDYMRTYRGAFVTSYLLASFAVAAAVTLMAVTILAHRHPPPALMWTLCLVKIGILALLLVLERAGRYGKFQEVGADLRYLAELLRPMQWLTPLGTYPPAVDLPLHAGRHDPRRSWMAWLARAAARSSPCVGATEPGDEARHEITIASETVARALDRARVEWLQGQLVYHWRAAARMHILDHGLERMAKRLVWTVLIAAVIACVIELSGNQPLHRAATLLGAIAAFLPAFIAAFAGISFQSEAKRLAMRSDAMHDALRFKQSEPEWEANRLRASGPRNSRAVARAAAVLKKASKMTIEEAGDWKVLYQIHEIHAA